MLLIRMLNYPFHVPLFFKLIQLLSYPTNTIRRSHMPLENGYLKATILMLILAFLYAVNAANIPYVFKFSTRAI